MATFIEPLATATSKLLALLQAVFFIPIAQNMKMSRCFKKNPDSYFAYERNLLCGSHENSPRKL